MATDVDVQYFSHLNGLILGNNWGDLIRLLDTCLVNGLPLTSITSASIDAQGDIHLTTYAAHKSMLFQIVELSGFAPVELNGKYRIKGIPSTNELILKAEHVGKTITTTGGAKLASLGYEIVFRDTSDVKRVYRAKNPTVQHPFIRVDETISDGTNSYLSTYAKYAMVGLLEHMDHIDNYQNPNVLQLPFDPSNPAKNWKITGTGVSVVRGWSCWYWSRANNDMFSATPDSSAPTNVNHTFTLCGDKDAFYFLNDAYSGNQYKSIKGCGLHHASLNNSMIPNWFLMSLIKTEAASHSYQDNNCAGGLCLAADATDPATAQTFSTPKYSPSARLSPHIKTQAITPTPITGANTLYSASNVPALEYPIYDNDKTLRGSLKHVYFCGKNLLAPTITTVLAAEDSMYIYDGITIVSTSNIHKGGVYFYLGELG